MAVLHILLGILKIAGILLAVLLGLLLLILSCVLFCPVVYQGVGEKNQDSLKGSLKISWLFRGISLKVWYEEGTHYSVRICGISTEQFKRIFKRRAGKKTEKKQPKELTAVQENSGEAKKREYTGQSPREAIQKEAEKAEEQAYPKEKPKRKGIGQSFADFRLTIEKICDKIKKVKKILKSEQMKRTKTWMLKEIKSLIFHIKPKKLQGNIRFGLEDPCLTGEILAVAGVFYPLYGEYFTIEPFFEEQILEGEISFRGRIYGIYFAFLAWRIFQNRELRFIIKKFKYL
ncbi:MAG: DUF2953 domain-containing protein [Blautia sp.]|nr:DUF2953 domain-containing protein [Blautia sp.]